jgi:hypothetical protein
MRQDKPPFRYQLSNQKIETLIHKEMLKDKLNITGNNNKKVRQTKEEKLMKKLNHSGSNNIGGKKGETKAKENPKAPFFPSKALARAREIPVEVLPSRKQRKSMHELVEAGDMEEAMAQLRGGLKATKKFWSPVEKAFIEEPDYKIRMDAAKTVIAYGDGMPVQRSIAVSDSFESLRDALNAAAGQSALARLALSQSFGLKPANSLQDDEYQEHIENE